MAKRRSKGKKGRKKNEDCYFYYYSTCSRGDKCHYRHEPRAHGCEEVCQEWMSGLCQRSHCNLRHMEIKKDRRNEPCYFEKTPQGCCKPHCPFRHMKSADDITLDSRQTKTEFSRNDWSTLSRPRSSELRAEDHSTSKHQSSSAHTHRDSWGPERFPRHLPSTQGSDCDLISSTGSCTVTSVQTSGSTMPSLMPDSDSEDDLPPGWEERATVDGSVYYVNHSTKCTQWTHPRTGKKKKVAGDLPFGWEKVVEDNGKILYVDHENHRTTYTDPRLAFAQEEKDSPLGFRQRFDGSSTALQVLHGRDLSGKTAVVTGANCGIGFETARALARHGCHVVLACRSVERASKAIERIRAERPQALCSAVPLDLSSLKSVKEFVNKLRGNPQFNRGVDILILNAGVFALPHTLTEDGLETTLQVNYLSQFYLALLMEEMLARAAPSRVVFVSSESHRFSTMNANNVSEDWLNPKPVQFWSMMAYNDSKLCGVVAARELARRWVTRDICVFSCHPGNLVSSDISRYWCPYRLLFTLVRPFTKSLEQAASTQVFCASALELSDVSGLYFNNCCRCEPSKPSHDPQLAAKLWKVSLDLIASHFSSLDIPDKYRNKP